MNKVKIIVDSSVDLTKEIYQKYDIDVLPLNINFDWASYLDGVDITTEMLFKKVEEKGKLPRTSACSPFYISESFKKYIDQGMDIIFLGLSSTFSSTYQNAFIAASEFPNDRIFLVDSGSLSSGTGLLVLKAAKLAKENKSAKEISDELKRLVPNVVAQFTIDELVYLYKGGRCSAASELFGRIFNIKPYIKVIDGKMIVYKKPRGSMKNAIDAQLDEVRKSLDKIDQSAVIITHSLIDDDLLEYTKNKLSEMIDINSIIITTSGCVISSHCGKGCIGILYITK